MNISMQRQLVALLPLVISSSIMAGYIGQKAMPLASFAIATIPIFQSLTIEQSIPSLPGKLALNRTQQENIVSINQELTQQIENILTTEQLQNFTATLSEGLTLKFALQDLALSPEQSNLLRTALKSAQMKIQQVLTPKQLEYIQQQYKNRDRQQQNDLQLTASLFQ
ncbi:MAG: hypothetical protein AAFO95_20080 [Cyanobacteria bacterium J06600_6]